ncbi:MAG: hypothetical protein K2O45_00230, partial [Oscillospiraceae bacterium]|nr:hypothetical protein [Oscillospiraceae bacterium]
MKRRFSAAVLALCLTLALLPAPALAAEADGTEYWVDMSAGEAGAMLNAVAAKSESRYMVFVYYDAATAQNPVETQFRSSANKNKHYIYGYNASSGGSLVDALAPLFGGSTALTLPVAVTWNPSTKTCIAKDNVRQMTIVGDTGAGINGLLDIMKENGLTNGSSAPDMSPSDPDTPAPPDG